MCNPLSDDIKFKAIEGFQDYQIRSKLQSSQCGILVSEPCNPILNDTSLSQLKCLRFGQKMSFLVF